MDFTPLELEKGASRWNYYSAVELVMECEKLALSNDLLRIPNTFTRIVSESYSKAIITTKEILTLLYHGYPEGAMALSRILYESMVIMRFLYVHRDNEQLLERYIDDYYVKVSRDRIKYCNYLLDYSQSEEEKEEAQRLKIEARKEYNKLKDKYSDYLSYNKQGNYLHDYWWIGDVMKSRNFGAIQNEITLENLKYAFSSLASFTVIMWLSNNTSPLFEFDNNIVDAIILSLVSSVLTYASFDNRLLNISILSNSSFFSL